MMCGEWTPNSTNKKCLTVCCLNYFKLKLDLNLSKINVGFKDISSCECAWADGNVAFSVIGQNDPLCTFNSPGGGVKECTPKGSKADVWCYKGWYCLLKVNISRMQHPINCYLVFRKC